MASSCRSSSVATPGCAHARRCRAASSCTRSTRMAATRRRTGGYPCLPPARRWDASGCPSPITARSQARYGIAWGAVGALMACYDWALQYAQQRVQFGKPIGSFQLVQQKLVWMLNEITKAQLLVLQLGRLKDAGQVRPQQVSLAKMNNVQVALDGARMARDILGAAGIVDEHPIIRHMLNLETVNTYEGTHDIHILIVGRDVTGLDAFGAGGPEMALPIVQARGATPPSVSPGQRSSRPE